MNSADQGYAHIATYIRGSAVAVMSTEEPHSLQPAETAPAIALLKKGARRGRYVFSLPAGHSTWEAVLSAAEPIADKLFFSDGVIHNEERLYVPTLSAFAAVWGIDPARFEAMFAHIIERDGKREFIVAGGVAASEDGSLQGGGLLPGQSWNGRFPAAQDIASTNAPVRPAISITDTAVYGLHFLPAAQLAMVWNRGQFGTGTITLYFPCVSLREKAHRFSDITRLVGIAKRSM